jgi:hypothetical protein
MRNWLNNPWVVAALAVAALALVAKSFYFQSEEGASPAARRSAAIAPLPTGETAALDGDALKTLLAPSGPRDPFGELSRPEAAAAPAAAATDTVRLSAIWTQNGETFVLIDGHVLQAGDRLGRLRIESATQEGVWIGHGRTRDFISFGRTATLITPTEPAPAPQAPPPL